MIKSIIEGIKSPDKEFAPIPFWFLNDELTEEEIVRQLRDFHDKGVYGVVLHPRIGIPESIPYLSDRFMYFVKVAVETAASLGMVVVLYDEAMYPSGSAHGLVVAENPRYAAQAIILTDDCTEGKLITRCKSGKYIVQVNSGGTIRGIHFGEDDLEENAPPAADLLSQASVDTFIRLTHQRYFETLGEYFGNTVIGFFTDEPSVLGRYAIRNCFAWTWDFETDFEKAGGKLEELEGLFTNEENESTDLYRKMIFQRELDVYYKSLHCFCEEHGTSLMGHPHQGDDIECEKHFDIPGQDIVLRWIAPEKDPLSGNESAQGKCSADAARIDGKRRNSNECFGVCVRDDIPWYFTGSDMKWYIDYLGVRGVNMFIPHAFYYSVRDARKDERPPDVGPNNIWWEHYGKISDYIKRISYIMSDSTNEARTVVMCENRNMRIDRVRELYENQVEFNYLPYADFDVDMVKGNSLVVGNNTYNYVYCDDKSRVPSVRKIEGVKSLKYRDIYTEKPCPTLRVSRIRKNGVRMIFLTNEGDTDIVTKASIDDETALIAVDLWNGCYWKQESEICNGKTYFELSLKYRESLLLILDCNGAFDAPLQKEKEYASVVFNLINHDEVKHVKTYASRLNVDTVKRENMWICVDAEEMVECFTNGHFVGFSLWNKHEFNIAPYLHNGENEVILKVTGNAANRFTNNKIPYGLKNNAD